MFPVAFANWNMNWLFHQSPTWKPTCAIGPVMLSSVKLPLSMVGVARTPTDAVGPKVVAWAEPASNRARIGAARSSFMVVTPCWCQPGQRRAPEWELFLQKPGFGLRVFAFVPP